MPKLIRNVFDLGASVIYFVLIPIIHVYNKDNLQIYSGYKNLRMPNYVVLDYVRGAHTDIL